LTYRLTNRTERSVAVTVAGNLLNPVGYNGSGDVAPAAGRDNGLGGNVNRLATSPGLRTLLLSNPTVPEDFDHLCRGFLPDSLAARRLV